MNEFSMNEITSAQCRVTSCFTPRALSFISCTMTMGDMGIIWAWTMNAYFSVPLYRLVSENVLDSGYPRFTKVGDLEDGTEVSMMGRRLLTKWGAYVEVQKVANVDVSGWVHLYDVKIEGEAYPVSCGPEM